MRLTVLPRLMKVWYMSHTLTGLDETFFGRDIQVSGPGFVWEVAHLSEDLGAALNWWSDPTKDAVKLTIQDLGYES